MGLKEEIARRRTFGIISHPDAGKTTLTEKLLLFGGAIHEAGAVKSNKIKKTATSDFMEIERQRGISVATSVMGFEYKNYKVNILDTPGHQDFAEDTFRTLTAVDSVIIVVSGMTNFKTVSHALMYGADDYISKPFDNSIFMARLKANARTFFLYKELEKRAVTDGLTGLYNHRHMEDVSTQEFIRAARYQTDLSCLLMDLDYFKKVNDTFGHTFGDVVLKEFSLRVKRNLRSADSAFRYGGEEFMVLLPHTGIEGARQTAEKLRAYCEANPYTDGTTSEIVTVSIGLASVKEHDPQSAGDLISYADKALYRAKAEGRNRIAGYLNHS